MKEVDGGEELEKKVKLPQQTKETAATKLGGEKEVKEMEEENEFILEGFDFSTGTQCRLLQCTCMCAVCTKVAAFYCYVQRGESPLYKSVNKGCILVLLLVVVLVWLKKRSQSSMEGGG